MICGRVMRLMVTGIFVFHMKGEVPTISIPITNSPVINPTNTAHATMNNSNTNTISVYLINVHELFDRFGAAYDTVSKSVAQLSAQSMVTLSDWFFITYQLACAHKWSLACGACASVCVSCYGLVWWLQRELSRSNAWIHWKDEFSLDELFAKPQAELAELLVRAAEGRYAVADNPIDFITPLSTFLKELDREDLLIQRYESVVSWLDKVYCARLVGVKKKLVAQCPEWRHRIAYLRGLLMHWLAEHQVQSCRRNGVLCLRQQDNIAKPMVGGIAVRRLQVAC